MFITTHKVLIFVILALALEPLNVLSIAHFLFYCCENYYPHTVADLGRGPEAHNTPTFSNYNNVF